MLCRYCVGWSAGDGQGVVAGTASARRGDALSLVQCGKQRPKRCCGLMPASALPRPTANPPAHLDVAERLCGPLQQDVLVAFVPPPGEWRALPSAAAARGQQGNATPQPITQSRRRDRGGVARSRAPDAFHVDDEDFDVGLYRRLHGGPGAQGGQQQGRATAVDRQTPFQLPLRNSGGGA